MTEVGTLKELGVGVGDVVECVGWSYSDGSEIGVYTGLHWKIYANHPKGYCGMCAVCKHGYTRIDEGMLFRIISRATPKLWRDMTPEEKGALLLAAHEGKVIENRNEEVEWGVVEYPAWYDYVSYRIKPEPKVETVTLYGKPDTCHSWDVYCDGDTHRITFNLIDGKPDCASVKMEEL